MMQIYWHDYKNKESLSNLFLYWLEDFLNQSRNRIAVSMHTKSQVETEVDELDYSNFSENFISEISNGKIENFYERDNFQIEII